MSRLASILRYIWDGLGQQTVEVTYSIAHSLSVKIPSQLIWAGLLVLASVGFAFLGVSVCGNGSVSGGPYQIP